MSEAADTNDGRLPVTVLTGFLGAGKTTLLNRILTGMHGQRLLVIINEFGEVGIDHDLVVASDETILQMNNGCICCTVRSDLIAILRGFVESGERCDGVIIETTGLADPGPVIQTFFVDPILERRLRLDAVVTVADLLHLEHQLATCEEAMEQIAMADIVVLNKGDLVDEAARQRVAARVKALNPLAKTIYAQRCDINLTDVLTQHAFDLDRITSAEPEFLTSGHEHEHDETIASVSLVSERPMDPERLVAWLSGLLQERGVDILRCKGIINVAGSPFRFAVQGVHMILDGDFQRRWMDGEQRNSRLVFIGRDLDATVLTAALDRCAAAPSSFA